MILHLGIRSILKGMLNTKKTVIFFSFCSVSPGSLRYSIHYFISVKNASFRYNTHTVLTNLQFCNLEALKNENDSTEKKSYQLAPATDVFYKKSGTLILNTRGK